MRTKYLSKPENRVVVAIGAPAIELAYRFARDLDCPLDVILIERVVFTTKPFLGPVMLGVVTEDGFILQLPPLAIRRRLTPSLLEKLLGQAALKIEWQARLLQAVRTKVDLAGRSILLVGYATSDDLAVRAAFDYVKARGSSKVDLALFEQMGREQAWTTPTFRKARELAEILRQSNLENGVKRQNRKSVA